MKLHIYLHECHRNYSGESLLFRALESLTELEIVERVSKADLIISGPGGFHYNKQPLYLHHVPKIRNIILSTREPLQASKEQATLFNSPEPPPIGFYKSSNCMFGVSSELLYDDPTYFRLPLWMECLDWSSYGIRDSTTDRAGSKAKAADLAKERNPSSVLNKPLELAFITSHLTGFRSDVVHRLERVLPIHGYGPFYNHEIKHHSESNFTKMDILGNYAFNLCPENTIYPGYVTEKIYEAYVCNTIPITLADLAACSLDFNTDSFINLYESYAVMTDYLSSIMYNKQKLASIASQPLFKEPPSLEPFLMFLKSIISSF
jgi:hypothetical protein